jgi:hypothetical protein
VQLLECADWQHARVSGKMGLLAGCALDVLVAECLDSPIQAVHLFTTSVLHELLDVL